jgi:transcriptional regulator with XRE-family HTH domain
MKPVQCRMARAGLGWSTLELAAQAGVAGNTVSRFETGQDAQISSVQKMRDAFEGAGIEFIDGDEPGLKLKAKKARKSTLKPLDTFKLTPIMRRVAKKKEG